MAQNPSAEESDGDESRIIAEAALVFDIVVSNV